MYKLTGETLDYLLNEMAEDQLDLLHGRRVFLRFGLEAQSCTVNVLHEGRVQGAVLQDIGTVT